MLNSFIKFFFDNKLVTFLVLIMIVLWGLVTAPFDFIGDDLPRDPVPVDAIPDIGENQQIVFSSWPGRSPRDIEDQVTYPLTSYLLGLPGVKTIRSSSMLGFSSIYIIFDESIEFYWSRSRILEKLNSIPGNLLPEGVKPKLGPDATALGQVFWYTLEGLDPKGKPVGGWDLNELRSIQDYYVKPALSSVEGVSEVASIGGFVQEYQVDLKPEAMREYDVSLDQIMAAIKNSNEDIGARTLEMNKVEYFVRGIGTIENLKDLEEVVVTSKMDVPVRLKDVAMVHLGPAERRGILDKSGGEAAGGVVVAAYGANPAAVIASVKNQINEVSGGLPSKTLSDGTVSKVNIVPFYDRSTLIKETIGTLESALRLEILVTILVIILMVMNLRASFLVSGMLPVAVLMCFIAMRYLGVDANVVALSGIAIAIGTMVDMGIVLVENMIRHLNEADPKESKGKIILAATSEVAGAVVTAVITTIISFIPVFAMQAAEGKLFRPLAFTKTFALISAIFLALAMIPMLSHLGYKINLGALKKLTMFEKITGGLFVLVVLVMISGTIFFKPILLALLVFIVFQVLDFLLERYLKNKEWKNTIFVAIAAFAVVWFLANEWMPLGPSRSFLINLIFVVIVCGSLIGMFHLFIRLYPRMLKWCLENKLVFLSVPFFIILWGTLVWLGFNGVFGFVAKGFDSLGVNIRTTTVWSTLNHSFPGTEKEFMPALDEGAFLLMPSTTPNAGVTQAKVFLQQLDMAVTSIPEVEMVVGKAGRVESPLDPAPLSMYENVIIYKPEYVVDSEGRRMRFRVTANGEYERDSLGNLVEDNGGKYFRNWRDEIKSPDDIWEEIAKVSKIPGLSSAPRLQPIETRLIMLQTGIPSPLAVRVKGSDLDTIQVFADELEKVLKEVPAIRSETVTSNKVVAKPYLNFRIDRQKISRYGLTVHEVQKWIGVAVGGMPMTSTIEGRERYNVTVRYPRELRNSPEEIGEMVIQTPTKLRVPLREVVGIEYEQGPQVIKSENSFQVAYVLFDRQKDRSEIEAVNEARRVIEHKLETGELRVPAGISWEFAGTYENQVHAEKRLKIIFPIVLAVIFIVLYLQFRSVPVTLMVFSGIAVAFAGGFIMIGLYGEEWFMNFSLFGTNLRDLFNMHTVYLSVAVWVGFIALFGIATDDGVVIATYLKQTFDKENPQTRREVREAVIEAGKRRIRPCLMTTATTLLALLPVLTSTGRGSDIMIPMAIPTFGGMTIELITLFVVPVLYSAWQESRLNKSETK